MSQVLYECALCGNDLETNQAPAGCDICHGGAEVQQRAYTLSAVRSGRAPQEDRYGNEGSLAPKDSPLVVGGAIINPSRPQN